jgi:hypothetical protein
MQKIKLTGKSCSHDGIVYQADKNGEVTVPDEAGDVLVRFHGARLIEYIPEDSEKKDPEPPSGKRSKK